MRPLRLIVTLAASISLASCTPTQPGATLVVSSITPSSGTTLGGTRVTITGMNFSAGATVAIGGVAATSVTVTGPTLLTATTAQHVAGVVAVAVTASGATGSLPGAFTYVAPPATTNTPPTIASLSARGSRVNEPAQFADVDEEIAVTAAVQDAETDVSQLTYEWTSNAGGTFSGSGASVKWRAPLSPPLSPITASLTLTVIERYSTVDDTGLPSTKENRVSKSTSISVHDSKREVGDMARQFLLDFSDSSIRDVDYVLRNFTTVGFCAGERAAEFNEIAANRRNKRITSFRIDPATVTVDFRGLCNFLASPTRWKQGDACAVVPSEWHDVSLVGDPPGHVRGLDQVPAVYLADQERWALCGSNFEGVNLVTGLRVTRKP